MDITFRSGSPMAFTADLTVGHWSAVTLTADPAFNGGGIRIVTFTSTSLQVSDCYLPQVMFAAIEVAASPRLSIAIQNGQGGDLTVEVPNEPTVTVASGDRVVVDYP